MTDLGLTAPPEKPDRAAEIAELAIAEINRLGKHRYDPKTETTVLLAKKLAKKLRTDDEILLVIRSKKGWVGHATMHEHFCPETLLGPKNFARYLDDARGRRPNGNSGPVFLAPPESDEPDPQGAMKLT